MRGTYTIGALGRRSFRRVLLSVDIKYTEDAGFLDSQFIVDATVEQHRALNRWIDDVNKSNSMTVQTYKVSNGGEANEFLDLVEKCGVYDSDQTVETRRGWFKTKVDVFTTPDNHARYKTFVNNL